MKKKRVLICGSRNWTNRVSIEEQIRKLPPGVIVIHGGCRGADIIAGDIAKKYGFAVEVYKANWNRFGLSAGPLRNLLMLDLKPIKVLAFTENIHTSIGTRHTVTEALRRDISVQVISQ